MISLTTSVCAFIKFPLEMLILERLMYVLSPLDFEDFVREFQVLHTEDPAITCQVHLVKHFVFQNRQPEMPQKAHKWGTES